MKSADQEITEILISNSGNKLTKEMIAGMRASILAVFNSHQQTQKEPKGSDANA